LLLSFGHAAKYETALFVAGVVLSFVLMNHCPVPCCFFSPGVREVLPHMNAVGGTQWCRAGLAVLFCVTYCCA